MGRRRRKVVKIPKKQLPKIFVCPKCGKNSVRVILSEDPSKAILECGSCGLGGDLVMKPAWAPVDAYAFWVDKYHKSELG